MNLLLDIHAFMYLTEQPSAFPAHARAAIEDRGNTRFLRCREFGPQCGLYMSFADRVGFSRLCMVPALVLPTESG